MTIWFATPSARPIAEAQACFDAWMKIGCEVAASRDNPSDCDLLQLDCCVPISRYRGYYREANELARWVLKTRPTCNIIVTGGDDIFPDPTFSADRLEAEFIEYFGGTLGVMQPTGLAWNNEIINGRETQERIAWGPWLGREWCERAYMGKGPYWDAPYHFFADELLQLTAERLGLFWQRRDIMQEHRQTYGGGLMHEFRRKANERWDADMKLFELVRHPDWYGAQLLPIRR